MDLLVGCPAVRRGWVLPRWVDHVEKAAATAGVVPRYIVLADPADDAWAAVAPIADRLTRVETVDERDTDERDWCPDRFVRMVELRNQLLAAVRRERPAMFLSCDSDILLHPDALANMLETSAQFDVVGGYTFMDASPCIPSWGRLLPSGAIDRQPIPGYVGRVDVVMAVKLMKPAAYNVDYQHHDKGEDIGICVAWRDAGVTVGLDARVACKHVMERGQLNQIDPRCGF